MATTDTLWQAADWYDRFAIYFDHVERRQGSPKKSEVRGETVKLNPPPMPSSKRQG